MIKFNLIESLSVAKASAAAARWTRSLNETWEDATTTTTTAAG